MMHSVKKIGQLHKLNTRPGGLLKTLKEKTPPHPSPPTEKQLMIVRQQGPALMTDLILSADVKFVALAAGIMQYSLQIVIGEI